MGIMLGPSLPLAYLQKLSFSSKSIEPWAIKRLIAKDFEASIRGKRFESDKTGELGFEPRQTAPEAVVLPLHYSPNNKDPKHCIKVQFLH